jgi:hypothetical protein
MKAIKFSALVILGLFFYSSGNCQQTDLSKLGLNVIPYPQQVTIAEGSCVLPPSVSIALDANATAADKFAAARLSEGLKAKWRISAAVSSGNRGTIRLTRKKSSSINNDEGYTIAVGNNEVVVQARGEAGLYHGVETLLQLIREEHEGISVRNMKIADWPATKIRAIHYDTKHHQDKREYVEELIRTLAEYKVNMLIWEWEDKFAYPSHPEIGAPGAFTPNEIRELTKYAQQYHIQIVPLVQGLGHSSYILKWPQFAHLREIPASNFEFCPFKEGTYKLLMDLWKDALAATGSKYIHIGSDETFELGACPVCHKAMEEKGSSWLYHRFVDSAAAMLLKLGYKPMVWERPMHWQQNAKPNAPVKPPKGLILTEEYNYESPDLKYAQEARAAGYPVLAYDPNPGIEPLFLPYYFKKQDGKEIVKGALEDSYEFLTSNLSKNVYDGVIKTSWDDSGVPTQGWMLSFVTTAAYSWNPQQPGLEEFEKNFYRNYFGNNEQSLDSLYRLLNEGAYFYYESFERQVWHYGVIGKTHLPDLPRGDALEYDPYWNERYATMIGKADSMKSKMQTALDICRLNLSQPIRHAHDVEIMQTIASLVQHTAQTYLDLSALEGQIRKAHVSRFVDYGTTYAALLNAQQIVEKNISERHAVYDNLLKVWEKTRLPKGLSTSEKQFFFRQDMTRHFANRTADMSYLIIDEQDLDLEGYLTKLKTYTKDFHDTFMGSGGEKIENNFPSPGYRNVNTSEGQ